MPKKPSERRVIMAKKIAAEWLSQHSAAEYRFRVYHNGDTTPYVNLLRSFRDDRIRFGRIEPLPDLGIKHEVEGFTVWSNDCSALQSLKTFLEKKGMDTTWIW